MGETADAEIINGEATAAIKDLRKLPGKDMVMWGSVLLAQSLMKENLIDEYRLQLCSVLTGGGRTLFPEFSDHQNLKLINVTTYNTGTVLLRYEPKTGI